MKHHQDIEFMKRHLKCDELCPLRPKPIPEKIPSKLHRGIPPTSAKFFPRKISQELRRELRKSNDCSKHSFELESWKETKISWYQGTSFLTGNSDEWISIV